MVRFLPFYCETDALASICFPRRGALPFKQNISSEELKAIAHYVTYNYDGTQWGLSRGNIIYLLSLSLSTCLYKYIYISRVIDMSAGCGSRVLYWDRSYQDRYSEDDGHELVPWWPCRVTCFWSESLSSCDGAVIIYRSTQLFRSPP